jgi:cytochrome c oxidase subunit IV
MNEHEPSLKAYFITFGLLLTGLAATVAVAYVPLGAWNLSVAMIIASAKASLVVLIFMHVRYAPKLTWIVVAAGGIWLAILIAIAQIDYATRDWIPTRE